MSRARKIFLCFCGLCLTAVGGVGLSGATFTAQKANPSNTFTAASSFCADIGLHSVTADRDTYVDEGNATTPNGGASQMLVRSRNGGPKNARTLVGFSLPTKPSSCSVTQATLKLSAATGSSTGRTIEAALPSSGWTEAGATWNNQPSGTVAGTSVTVTSGAGLKTWTVTSQVQGMYSGTYQNNGFRIKDQTEDNSNTSLTQTYATRDQSVDPKPTLEVTFG
jgi:hypothetical protein